jgi:ABC-2 type transport system permease protein
MFGLDVISTVLTAAANASYPIVVGIVIVLFVCRDFSQGTVKTIIARGIKRESFYFAKLIVVTVIALAFYLAVIIFGFIFGLLFFGFNAPDSARWLGVLGVQLVAAPGTAYLAFFASDALKRMGPSIIIVIIVPTVVELVITLVDLFLETNTSDYFITTVFNFLSSADVSVSRLVAALITSLVYTAIFIAGGYLLSRKTEY